MPVRLHVWRKAHKDLMGPDPHGTITEAMLSLYRTSVLIKEAGPLASKFRAQIVTAWP